MDEVRGALLGRTLGIHVKSTGRVLRTQPTTRERHAGGEDRQHESFGIGQAPVASSSFRQLALARSLIEVANHCTRCGSVELPA